MKAKFVTRKYRQIIPRGVSIVEVVVKAAVVAVGARSIHGDVLVVVDVGKAVVVVVKVVVAVEVVVLSSTVESNARVIVGIIVVAEVEETHEPEK